MPTRRTRFSVAASVCVFSLVFEPISLAQNASARESPISISWAAPESCPNEEAIVARVESLLGGVPAAGDRRLRAVGTVETIARGFRMELVLSSGQSGSTRVLQAVSCEALADAGALVIALAFDPEAVTAQEIKRAEAAASATSTPLPSEPDPHADHDHAAPVSTVKLVPIPVPIFVPPVTPPSSTQSVSRPTFGGFVSFTGDVGSTPAITPGVIAGLSLGLGAYRIEPAFQAWPSSRKTLVDRPDVGVQISLLTFALSGCRRVLPWSDATSMTAMFGCVGFEVGEMKGQGFGVSNPAQGGALWAAPKLDARVELSLLSWLSLNIHVGIAIPVDRKRFVLDLTSGRAAVHEPAQISGRAGAGLGLRF